MRLTGTIARGIRLPIITQGEELAPIVVDSLLEASSTDGFTLHDRDVVAITESIVAKSQSNFVSIDDIASDIREKYPEGSLGLTFPIMSRNRFFNILKGISKGVDKLYILMSYPTDEVGNPIADSNIVYEKEDEITDSLLSEAQFRALFGEFLHPFTGTDYIELYKSISSNIEIWFSKRPTDILRLTPYVLDCSIHTRFLNKKRLEKAGAKRIYTLSDIMTKPLNNSGYNDKYGLLGSNLSTENRLKLFPRDPKDLVETVQKMIHERTGAKVEVMVYGDGAFKDPACGIWEFADPVVSPAYTKGLDGTPNELKLKYIADANFGHLTGEAKKEAVSQMIKQKDPEGKGYAEGTTPRRYFDLLGSLCDLISGSGDKGTPVVLVQGYFDNYTDE